MFWNLAGDKVVKQAKASGEEQAALLNDPRASAAEADPSPPGPDPTATV